MKLIILQWQPFLRRLNEHLDRGVVDRETGHFHEDPRLLSHRRRSQRPWADYLKPFFTR